MCLHRSSASEVPHLRLRHGNAAGLIEFTRRSICPSVRASEGLALPSPLEGMTVASMCSAMSLSSASNASQAMKSSGRHGYAIDRSTFCIVRLGGGVRHRNRRPSRERACGLYPSRNICGRGTRDSLRRFRSFDDTACDRVCPVARFRSGANDQGARRARCRSCRRGCGGARQIALGRGSVPAHDEQLRAFLHLVPARRGAQRTSPSLPAQSVEGPEDVACARANDALLS